MSKTICLKPFTLNIRSTKSLRAAIRDLLDSVESRQVKYSGSDIRGKVFRHLVEARLSLILPAKPNYTVTIFPDSFSCSDCEFFMGDVVVHVPSFPGEAVIRKCQRNLDDGKRPILITTYKRVSVAECLADDKGIADRIDVFDIEQFLVSNLYELGLFSPSGRKETVMKLISAYNAIIDSCEADPSLRISLSGMGNSKT